VQQFQHIINDIKLNAYVTYLDDLILRAFESGKPQLVWFQKIITATTLIDNGLDAAILTNILEVQLLQPLGVAPNWHSCVVGGESAGIFDYSPLLGGIICSRHWEQDPHRLHLQPKTVAYLRMFAQLDFSKIGRIAVNPGTKAQLRQTLDVIYRDSVG
ncbi:DNA repair protein RecO, partial [Lactobacillus sp. XV13L]|nr:DNA repair protein RecO [Lactobacillus sp. XV13L]